MCAHGLTSVPGLPGTTRGHRYGSDKQGWPYWAACCISIRAAYLRRRCRYMSRPRVELAIPSASAYAWPYTPGAVIMPPLAGASGHDTQLPTARLARGQVPHTAHLTREPQRRLQGRAARGVGIGIRICRMTTLRQWNI
jgi:hypothetical protein